MADDHADGSVPSDGPNSYLVEQLADDVFTDHARWFIDLIEEWRTEGVEMRTFTFNTTDVTVSYIEGWAEITDVLEQDASYRLPLLDLVDLADRAANDR